VENGRRCICGEAGCLSTVASAEALLRGAAFIAGASLKAVSPEPGNRGA